MKVYISNINDELKEDFIDNTKLNNIVDGGEFLVGGDDVLVTTLDKLMTHNIGDEARKFVIVGEGVHQKDIDVAINAVNIINKLNDMNVVIMIEGYRGFFIEVFEKGNPQYKAVFRNSDEMCGIEDSRGDVSTFNYINMQMKEFVHLFKEEIKNIDELDKIINRKRKES